MQRDLSESKEDGGRVLNRAENFAANIKDFWKSEKRTSEMFPQQVGEG